MNKKVKAVVTDYIEDNLDWEAQELAKAGIDFAAHQLKFKPEDEVISKIADADVVVVNMVKMPESLLSKLPKCKLIIRHGIGYDNVDAGACARLGIQFAYQPDYCMEDVAEHAISLIFACARKLPQSRKTLENSSARGQWDFSTLFPVRRLDGKTLGIVGAGRIGSRVYRKLQSFGFKIIICDPYLSQKRKDALGEATFVDKETLFRASDFITLHTPANMDTKHLVNAEALSWMKPSAFLINTSRASMIDTAALVTALEQRRIGGAAIDVFEVEPPPPDHPLFRLDNVILTPHLAWASEESALEIRRHIVNDILAFAAGKPARCLVKTGV
ncbi:MAG: C-terminal binding protein [Verrucomicrobiae bacterium]|nr:C-terminal binding protein [Verrucomicrobiae bacterium]